MDIYSGLNIFYKKYNFAAKFGPDLLVSGNIFIISPRDHHPFDVPVAKKVTNLSIYNCN